MKRKKFENKFNEKICYEKPIFVLSITEFHNILILETLFGELESEQ